MTGAVATSAAVTRPTRRLTSDRPSLNTLFLSAHTREALARDGIPDPGPDFLQKPFHPDALARKIREILDR